jgi:hypothetical protein
VIDFPSFFPAIFPNNFREALITKKEMTSKVEKVSLEVVESTRFTDVRFSGWC